MSKNPTSPYYLQPADIVWTEDGVPQSAEFGDVYYSRENGLNETRHVFLYNNRLRERWQQLDPHHGAVFTIGETGFGTGLNFLAAWQLWLQTAPANWHLHVVSVEKHPLTREQLARALALWPELEPLAAQLLAVYPPLIPGTHRLQLNGVTLDLIFDDANRAFNQCLDTTHPQHAATQGAKIDAWFLDGFAPSSNPDMWRDELFQHIALLSRAGTTFATFTAAGYVRRGLAAQGFEVSKVAGWGRKREMLSGVLPQPSTTALARADRQAWHSPPAPAQVRQVAVIGAGLAGCHTALALARRGIRVTVIDRHEAMASEASGNPQGLLYTKLSPQAGTLNQFTLSSFLFALRHYRPWLDLVGQELGEACGVLQLMRGDKEHQQWQALRDAFPEQSEWLQFVDADSAATLAGLPLNHPGIYFPTAGWLRPAEVCRLALAHEGIQFLGGKSVEALERVQDQWRLHDAGGDTIAHADAVVIASSHNATSFAESAWLPVKAIRGQISYVAADSVAALPRTALCHEGYVAPASDGQLTLGATFAVNDHSTELRDADHRINLASLDEAIPSLLGDQPRLIGGRAALRCASPDYLPMAGALPVREAFLRGFSALRSNAKTQLSSAGDYYPGLYLNIAHGSRGLTSTPLCAELIASLICNEPRPLGSELVKALSPARFLIRGLIRNQC